MPIRRLFGLLVCALSLSSAPLLAQTVSFVDEDGASTGTYLERTRVHVRVEDPSANTSLGAVDTVAVTLATALAGDSEVLTLTETGVSTGVFAGSMDLETGAAPSLSGVLETALQAGPPVVRDTLTATYSPSVTDTAGMAGARIQLVDDRGRPAAGYTEADWVNVRVEDHVLYNDPGLRDGVTVAVFVFSVSDEELITLQETGNATGIYEGRIRAVLHTTSDDDGLVGAPVGNLVQGQYALSDAQEHVDAQVPLLGSRAEILDAQGEPVDFVAESSTIRLRAVDRLAGGPALVDTVQADVWSEIGLDEEIVTLTETAVASGVFEADLPTSIEATLPGSGRLETAEDAGPPHRFDTITLFYLDSFTASSDTAVTYGSETLFLDGFGNDAETYAMGSTIFVRVIDHNYDPNDSVQVTVRALRSGDIEIFTLWVTEEGPGIFEGSLPIRAMTNYISLDDDELQPFPVDTIEAMHTDALGNTASGDRAEVRYGKLELIDEQGRPTQELVESGLARVRLYGAQLNSSPYDAEQVSVLGRSALAGDEESFPLVETGVNTGIFEGRFPLAFTLGGPVVGNDTLETSNGGSPDYEQDTVTVEALDASAAATTVGARIWLIDHFGEDAATFAVGDLVGVRVEDHNVDNSQERQTLQAVVVNSQAGDVESVNLLETGYATGMFEGLIPSRLLTSLFVSDGTLDVQEGDLLQARHVWLHAPRTATDDAAVTGGSVRFVDAEGQPAESYLEAATAYVRLVYAAGNSSSGVDSVNVTVAAAISQDAESLVLMETGADTGIFTGSIALRTGSASPGDGFLQTERSTNPPGLDTLTVTHTWPGGSASDTATLTGSRIWFVDAAGDVTGSYAQSTSAYIRVEDHNADQPSLFDTVQVALHSLETDDYETLTLAETARDSGIFEGSMALKTGPKWPNGELQAEAPEEIEATYSGVAGGGGSPVRARITQGSVDFVDGAGAVTLEVPEGGLARLRVFFVNPNYYSDTVTVYVRSRYGNDTEEVMLTAVSYGGPVYEGSIQLRGMALGGALSQNGTLETSNSGSPEYLPDELTAEFGWDTAVAVAVASRVWFVDGYGRVSSTFPVGGQVDVRVEDHNLDDPLVREQIPVTVREAGSGDSVSLQLLETGYGTNVYEGTVGTEDAPVVPGDGTLQVQAGRVIEAERLNQSSPNPTVAQATMTSGAVMFLDAEGQPAEVYLERTRAYVRVTDSFADSSSSPDVVTVLLQSAITFDGENVSLTETGPSTGVFEGSVALAPGSASPNNGFLETGRFAGPPHELDTLTASYASVSGTVIDTAGMIGSRTSFIDSFGQPVDSYAAGSPARIQVKYPTGNQPEVTDSLEVTVRSLTTGDVETVTLGEYPYRGADIFEGTVTLEREDDPAANDGKLQSMPGEEIEVVHTDWAGVASSSDRALIRYASVLILDPTVDGEGEVLENGTARIRVLDTSGVSSVDVVVRSRYGGDQETVSLPSLGQGTFEGSLQLAFVPPGGAIPGNGVLETSNSGSPEYLQDELTAVYLDAEGSAVTVPSRITFRELTEFFEVTEYGAGSMIRLWIRDNNANADPAQVDTTTVLMTGTGDSETVTLTEMGTDAGLFEVWLPGSHLPGVAGDGVLTTAPNSVATAAHPNAHTPHPTTRQIPITGNFAPHAVDDLVETGQQPVTIDALANDSDPDGDPLVVAWLTYVGTGSVEWNADHTFTYTPAPGFVGTESFTYVASDQRGGTYRATVTVTVTRSNSAPIANDDSYLMDEDGAPLYFDVVANDTDPDNDPLQVTFMGQPSSGTVQFQPDGAVIYTPAPDAYGDFSFSYQVSDPYNAFDYGLITVTVNPVNDLPVANDDTATVAEDGSVAVEVLGNDSDPENGLLAVDSVTQGASGAVTIDGFTVTYTPNANFHGTDTFTYTVRDADGGTDTATVTVTVTPAEDAPVAVDDSAIMDEDTAVTIAVLANDTDLDNDTLTVTAVTQGTNGTVTLNPLTYTPNANFFGSDSFTYTASDGTGGVGGTDTATVTVTVTAVNDAPVAVNDSATTLAETPVTIQVRTNDTDVDSATLTVTAVTQGAHGAVAINGGLTVTYTPATAWVGPDNFTYTISDGAGGTATATVNVTVQAPPRVATNIQVLYTFNEGSGTTVNDVSGVGTPLNLTVASASAVTWLPGALSIDSNTLVQSAGTATKVINACKASNEVTVEAWVDPLNLTQTGPAAIVTISQNQTKRDVTLGQSGTAYNGQLRTSTTGQDGTQHSANNVATTNLTHVVYTRSSTGAVRIYVNGSQVATGTLTGNLSTWTSYNLALGGELSGTRYWRGEMHLVAIYSRALTATEVRQNFLAGAN